MRSSWRSAGGPARVAAPVAAALAAIALLGAGGSTGEAIAAAPPGGGVAPGDGSPAGPGAPEPRPGGPGAPAPPQSGPGGPEPRPGGPGAPAPRQSGPGGPSGGAAAPYDPPAPSRRAADVRLSDEWRLTRYAFAIRRATIRGRPADTAAPVARLRLWTEDGFPEPYVLLRRRAGASGSAWLRVRVPGRPNGRAGWVRASALGAWRAVRVALLVDRRRLRATLYRDGRPLWRARVGVGKRSTPTPAGRFWVRERFPVAGRTLYGPYAFGTSAYSVLTDWPGGGVVGIHGTDEPWLIPGRPSHGCIRLRNLDVLRLARLLPVGAPVRIA